ncbi:MAG: carbon-nitrogen hydrolase family protein [Clostridiales Family XIII bacterium]|jgi:predicted amidohydrolase|nr:carbon-nitrogen hydrolase family protein [Clostridiales Family XIII bacterium]
MERKYKIALCQTLVEDEKGANLAKVARFVIKAASNGAAMICLPEIWNCPYDVKVMADTAEPENGRTVAFMSELAHGEKIYLVGGSIPERDGDRVYNTSFVFDPNGRLIAKNRKTHLFDVDIDGGVKFKESDTFSPGNGPAVFDTAFGKVGLAICFDVRYPEMFAEMRDKGAHLVFLPAQFNTVTGPAHWELLMRSRGVDNQLFFAACSAARNMRAKYKSWGHSMIATPYGDLCGVIDEREGIVYGEIDLDYMDNVKRQIPLPR